MGAPAPPEMLIVVVATLVAAPFLTRTFTAPPVLIAAKSKVIAIVVVPVMTSFR